EPNEHLPSSQQWKILFSSYVVRSVAEDLNHNVGRAEYCGAVRENLRTFVGVLLVRVAGFGPSIGFDYNFKSGFDQVWNHHGNQRHAPLPGIRFFRYTKNHRATSFQKMW